MSITPLLLQAAESLESRRQTDLRAFYRRALALQSIGSCLPHSVAGPALEGYNTLLESLLTEAGVPVGHGASLGLEDFTATSELSVSNEGFKDLLGKIKSALGLGKIRKPAEVSKDSKAFITQAKKYIKDYYDNPKWLDAQEFVEGDIKASDFSGDLIVGTKMPKDPLAQAVMDVVTLDSYAYDYWQELRKFMSDAVDYNRKAVGKSDDEVAALFKEASAKLKQPSLLFPGNKVMGNWSSPRKERPSELTKGTQAGPAELPALTRDQIPLYAKAISNLLDEALELEGKIIYDASMEQYWDETPPLGGYKHFDPEHIMREFGPSCYPVDMLINTAMAFDKWINRSIK